MLLQFLLVGFLSWGNSPCRRWSIRGSISHFPLCSSLINPKYLERMLPEYSSESLESEESFDSSGEYSDSIEDNSSLGSSECKGESEASSPRTRDVSSKVLVDFNIIS
ncbi:hypothetical protein Pfo_022506 [Paulownia fortunei]|nr:hypothetical protein Pfo_022506 [Paulownia fortunei]